MRVPRSMNSVTLNEPCRALLDVGSMRRTATAANGASHTSRTSSVSESSSASKTASHSMPGARRLMRCPTSRPVG